MMSPLCQSICRFMVIKWLAELLLMQESYGQEICSAHWDNIREFIVFKSTRTFGKLRGYSFCQVINIISVNLHYQVDISSYFAQKQLEFRQPNSPNGLDLLKVNTAPVFHLMLSLLYFYPSSCSLLLLFFWKTKASLSPPCLISLPSLWL